MSDPVLPDDDDALAAEYVLGALDLGERSAAQARLNTDAGFAALVSDWQNRLSGLNDDYTEAPAPNLLPQIEARLFPKAPKPARIWLGWLAGAAIAASVALFFVLPQLTNPGELVATLHIPPGSDLPDLSYEARYGGGELTVTRVAGKGAAAGSVHQLWIIAPNAAPVSLGLLDGTTLTLTYPTPTPGWTLAVSVEPAGGSTTGAPTGPVILAAEIST